MANTYYFTKAKQVAGPMGSLTWVADLDPVDAGTTWAGQASTIANLPGYPNGSMIFCIATVTPLSNPSWPGVTSASFGQVTSWLQRTGDPSPDNAASWLGQ